MAEVGILNLQIHDNSAKAAEGLGRLASALERVRSSVGSGLKLGNIATQIEKINTAVSGAAAGGKVENLNKLASALKEVKEASNGIKTSNLKGAADIGKTGAESAAERIKKTTDEATEGFMEMKSGIEGTSESTEKMAKNMEQVFYSVKKAKRETKEFFSQYNPQTGNFEPLAGVKSMSDLNAYYAQQDALREAARVAQLAKNAELQKTDPIMAAARENASQGRSASGLKEVKSQVDGVAPEMQKVAEATEQASQTIEQVGKASESSAKGLRRIREALIGTYEETKSFRGAIGGLVPHLKKLGSELTRIAKRMAMRAVIRQFSEGFKEGLENLYFYSKAVGTDFVTSMDNAAGSMLYFKNSLGAAVAPAIMALVPLLQTVINWVVTAINYVNQFLALISGRGGWTKALPVAAEAFTETSKKAKGAGKAAKEAGEEVKELLADWDELNIIQSESGGGTGGGGGGSGAGSTAAEYSSMFEEVKGFNKELKSFVNRMEDEFGSVLNFVKEIGAAVLAWRVSEAFGGLIGQLAGLAGAVIAIDLVVKTTAALDKTYLDTGSEGWLILSALVPLVGGVFAKRLLRNVLSGSQSKLVIPVMLTLSAITDIVTLVGRTDVSALDPKSLKLSALSALKTGAAAGYLAYTLGGYSLGGSIAGGVATALMTFGVAVGIKAITQAVDSGVTMETLKAAALGSIALGVGAGVLAKAAGATLLGALVFGGAAAAITAGTLAVGIAIAARVNASKEDIQWGENKLTAEQIEAFVNAEMFTVDVKTYGKLVVEKIIQPSTEQREDIQSKLTTVLGDWKIIKLGIASEQDYDAMHADIDALIESIDTYVGTAKEAGKLTLQFTPTLVGDTEGEQKDWLTSYTQGWDAVDNFAETTGKRIGELLVKSEAGAITEKESEVLDALMTQMANVSSAVARGKMSSEAFGNMVLGIGDIDKASFEGIIEKYKAYQDELRQQLTAQVNEQYAMQGSLVAALFEIEGPNGKRYQAALEEYKRMGKNLAKSVEDGVRQYSASGANWILDFLKEKYADPLSRVGEGANIGGIFADELVSQMARETDMTTDKMADFMDGLIINLIDQQNSEVAKFLDDADISGWNILGENLREQIRAAMETALGPELTDEIIKLWEVENPIKEAVESAETPKLETKAEVDATVEENVTYETVEESVADATTPEVAGTLPVSVSDNLAQTDSIITEHTFPATNEIDTSATTNATSAMAAQVHSDVVSVINDLNWLNSLTGSVFQRGNVRVGAGGGGTMTVMTRATGGMVRSGEMFFANENGNIEMMGKMGNSTVVANNQQIVEGISRGVAQSNSGMESSMNMMVALMRQFVSKEFTAKVVPSSGLGRVNGRSGEIYNMVTGES